MPDPIADTGASTEVTTTPVAETTPTTETAAPTTAPTTETTQATETTGTQADPVLYDLPDGRKVTGEELRRLHVEELLPEFTRRSQELTTLKSQQQVTQQAPQPQQQSQQVQQQAEWVPQTWDEVLLKAEERAIARIQAQGQQEQEARTQVSTQVDAVLAELKAADPTLNENALFAHAVKYKFGDLKVAHQNMKDMNLVAKTTEQRTAQNLQQRHGTPIAGAPAGGGSVSADGIAYEEIRDESPQEFLRRIKNK